MAKFKQRRTKGRTTQWPNLNEEEQKDGQHNDQIQLKKDKGTDNTMVIFKRRTKGWTTQWPNLNKEGQRDEQHNGQI